MPLPDSRYSEGKIFTASPNGGKCFNGLRGREIARLAGVVEHTVSPGDRLDLLAMHYYNDPAAWWRLLDANPRVESDGIFSLDELVGEKIVIPSVGNRTQTRRA